MRTLYGLTGVIGSGKSRVAAALANLLGWPLLDCDHLAAQVMAPGGPGVTALARLADRFVDSRGHLRRELLRQAIFSDPELRSKVDRVIHPLIKEELRARLADLPPGARHVLVEVPLLFEAGWQDMFAATICVYARPQVCSHRLQLRDGLSREQATAALCAQMPLAQKVELADHVIDNSGGWWQTRMQIGHLAEFLRAEAL
ncbi:MAG: dephospho-CoA kinase [Thermodesulfobacteriota bacterium]